MKNDGLISMQLKKPGSVWNGRDEEGRPVAYKGTEVYKFTQSRASELLVTGDWEKTIAFNIRTGRTKTTTDIIIPTYDNELLTVDCINSIKRNTKKDTYRIIWVDNGSKHTSKVVKALSGVDSIHIRLTKNLGFVGAVNEGLRVSDGYCVCLLNNDTRVSKDWLQKLTRSLLSDSKLGIIGPLTQNIGANLEGNIDSQHNIVYQGTQRKLPEYVVTDGENSRDSDLDTYNKKLEEVYGGQVVRPSDFVPFLCAVMKRDVLESVGYLDPNFEMGMYDDNDYCHQAERNGYKLGLALDTCIFHRGRSTFQVLAKTENLNVKELLTKNHAYMIDKWSKQ